MAIPLMEDGDRMTRQTLECSQSVKLEATCALSIVRKFMKYFNFFFFFFFHLCRHSREAGQIRNMFKDYFCSASGAVDWQYHRIHRTS